MTTRSTRPIRRRRSRSTRARPFTTTRITVQRRGSPPTTRRRRTTSPTSGTSATAARKVDATGQERRPRSSSAPGNRKVTLTVTDEAGNSDTATKRFAGAQAGPVPQRRGRRSPAAGAWSTTSDRQSAAATATTAGSGQGKDVLTLDFTRSEARRPPRRRPLGRQGRGVHRRRAPDPLSFRGTGGRSTSARSWRSATSGSGEHDVRIVMTRKTGYVEGFVTQG